MDAAGAGEGGTTRSQHLETAAQQAVLLLKALLHTPGHPSQQSTLPSSASEASQAESTSQQALCTSDADVQQSLLSQQQQQRSQQGTLHSRTSGVCQAGAGPQQALSLGDADTHHSRPSQQDETQRNHLPKQHQAQQSLSSQQQQQSPVLLQHEAQQPPMDSMQSEMVLWQEVCDQHMPLVSIRLSSPVLTPKLVHNTKHYACAVVGVQYLSWRMIAFSTTLRCCCCL